MKKILSLVLVLVMLAALTACGAKYEAADADDLTALATKVAVLEQKQKDMDEKHGENDFAPSGGGIIGIDPVSRQFPGPERREVHFCSSSMTRSTLEKPALRIIFMISMTCP